MTNPVGSNNAFLFHLIPVCQVGLSGSRLVFDVVVFIMI